MRVLPGATRAKAACLIGNRRRTMRKMQLACLTGALLASACATPSVARDGWRVVPYEPFYGYGYYPPPVPLAPHPGYRHWGMTYAPPPYIVYEPPVYGGWDPYGSGYNPEHPIDPDPRIGGSFRMKSSED
jgi:hypothetical protein